jgi:hypothetical protein
MVLSGGFKCPAASTCESRQLADCFPPDFREPAKIAIAGGDAAQVYCAQPE